MQGFISTRNLCYSTDPFQEREIMATRVVPKFSKGCTEQVTIENLLRPHSLRPMDGCTGGETFRDFCLTPLITEWDQTDFRPLYFSIDTRAADLRPPNVVKMFDV